MATGILKSEKQVYEAYGLRADGSISSIEIIECDSDNEAIAWRVP